MTGLDAFYTPDCYAVQLLSHVVGTPRNAVDFCVGDGGLLKAAERRFAGIDCFGVDISDEVLTALQTRQPTWHLAQCDFTDAEALARIPFLQGAAFDLIVLNPPFTCRGSSIKRVIIGEEEYHVSTAMSFLVGALPYLSDKGTIYAILPISCVYSQKDRLCWQYLQENYHARVLTEIHKANFSGRCAPNIVLVYLGREPYPMHERQQAANSAGLDFSLNGIYRGRLGVYKTTKPKRGQESLPFIHTTNMRKGELVDVGRVPKGIKEAVKGYGVLIPRVCNPNKEKVVLLEREECVLSDCVVLLKTRTKRQAKQLKKYLLSNWTGFTKIYVGTGARYVTMERLKEYFHFEQIP